MAATWPKTNRTAQSENGLPEPVLLAFAPLHRWHGRGRGAVLAGVVPDDIALLLRGGYPIGPTLSLLGHYFPGYSVTWGGSLLGLGWGFVAGYLLGYGFALAHNLAVWLWLILIKSRAEMDQYGDFLDHM